eukprot:2364636-Rhodomonas_salina.2
MLRTCSKLGSVQCCTEHAMFAQLAQGFSYVRGRRFSIADDESECAGEQTGGSRGMSGWEVGYVLAVPGVVCLVLFFLLAGCAMSRI